MMDENDIAQRFKEGMDCAMVTLHEAADAAGIPREDAYRLASCFGIGMMQGSVCGAISAGFIAIGYKYGNDKPNDMDRKGLAMAKREEYLECFKERFGDDITCPGILKLDLRKQDDMNTALETGVLFTTCPRICKESAKMIRDIL